MSLRVILPLLAAGLSACGGGDWPPIPAPPPASGLDERPDNTTCVAPERDRVTIEVSARRAFANLRFSAPVAMVQAPGDASRWFVVEQPGRIRSVPNDPEAEGARDFLDFRRRFDDAGGAGLLGLAFHPNFGVNGLAYVSYATRAGAAGRFVAAEFASPDGGLTLDPGSERILLSIAMPDADRMGGQLAFGPDGYLYLGLGDGGEEASAQDPRRLPGKMLRIDVDHRTAGSPYAVPSDNPFAAHASCAAGGSGAAPCPEIFATGFRNPSRWSFDFPSRRLWLADDDPGSFGEIHDVERGGNYGRGARAGTRCTGTANRCRAAGLKDPVAEYGRRPGVALTGGFVYRGSQAPSLVGRYVFAESDGGLIASLAPAGGGRFSIEPLIRAGSVTADATSPPSVTAFGQSLDGELYTIDRERGEIRRLELEEDGGDHMPELLSETGCLNTGSAGAPPLLSLIPYGLNAAFWSDGAHKERWLGLPNGERIAVPDSGDWELPNGTVIVKHFRLGPTLAETRLFVRHPDGGWAGYTYRWNEAQTDATRVRGGLVAPVEGQDWIYPSESECLWCHNDSAGFSLGLETAQLNGDHTYPQSGRTRNQIATLNAIDVLSPPVSSDAPAYADPTDSAQPLEARARTYLHVNCSFCHRPGGPTPALMDLRYETPLAATGACDVAPALGDLGIPDARIIAPGDPARSELLARMSRRDASGMPPLASRLTDPEGIALIRDWIASLTAARCE